MKEKIGSVAHSACWNSTEMPFPTIFEPIFSTFQALLVSKFGFGEFRPYTFVQRDFYYEGQYSRFKMSYFLVKN